MKQIIKISNEQLLINANIEPSKRNKFFIPEKLVEDMLKCQIYEKGNLPAALIIDDFKVWTHGRECPMELSWAEENNRSEWNEDALYSRFGNEKLEDFVIDYLNNDSDIKKSTLKVLFTEYVILKNWEKLFERDRDEHIYESSIIFALIKQRKAICDYCNAPDALDADPFRVHINSVMNNEYDYLLKRMLDFDIKYRNKFASILHMVY